MHPYNLSTGVHRQLFKKLSFVFILIVVLSPFIWKALVNCTMGLKIILISFFLKTDLQNNVGGGGAF